MVKSKSKILLVIILTMIMISCVATTVFADNAIIIGGNTTNTNIAADNNTISDTNSATVNFTDGTNVTNNTTTNITGNSFIINSNNISQYNKTNTNTTSLPKTGESDIYVVIALIAVCGVSAIYAYKKIRDYNV